jgi:hypothetical protein
MTALLPEAANSLAPDPTAPSGRGSVRGFSHLPVHASTDGAKDAALSLTAGNETAPLYIRIPKVALFNIGAALNALR